MYEDNLHWRDCVGRKKEKSICGSALSFYELKNSGNWNSVARGPRVKERNKQKKREKKRWRFLMVGGEGDYGMNRLMNGRQRWFVRVIIEWQRWCAVTWVRLIDRLFVQIDQRLHFFFSTLIQLPPRLHETWSLLDGTERDRFQTSGKFITFFFFFSTTQEDKFDTYALMNDDDDVRFKIFKRSISSILLERKERLVTHNYLFIFTASEI